MSSGALERAVDDVCAAIEFVEYRTHDWTTMSEDELWRELVGCILGSRVRFEVAETALIDLKRHGLLRHPSRAMRFDRHEKAIYRSLVSQSPQATGTRRSYPFPRSRALQVRRAAEYFAARHRSVGSVLRKARDFPSARRQLVLEVSGLGPKQASLFLRNVGYTASLAVLDVHVLTYMEWLGLLDSPLRSVPSLRRYEAIESVFVDYAKSRGHLPETFDIAVWVVVRVLKRRLHS